MVAADAGAWERAEAPVALRGTLVVGCVAVAFWFSLRSLLGDWGYQTPLGDTVLVPVLAVVLGVAASRRHAYLAAVRLGRLDFGVGLLLFAVATFLLGAGPVLWSKYFWAMRVDLLTLPLFAAGAVLLLFGARALVPLAYPTAFLLLAWPLPYLALLERGLNACTSSTVAAVGALASWSGLAHADPGSDGSAFVVAHGGRQFSVAVGSACSGIDGIVGYLVVAAFAAYFVRGPRLRRAAVLLLGGALVWVFNVGRILVILGVGRGLGERAAFDVLHPVAGLLALNAAMLCLLPLARRLGVGWRGLAPAAVDSPIARPAPPHQRGTGRKLKARAAIVVAGAVLVALVDGQLAEAGRGLANDGRPAVAAFAADPVVGGGWRGRRVESIPWAAQYYGSRSTWVRYRLRPAPSQRHPFTIWLDAIQSPNLGALDAYSLAHCYGFHHFRVELARRVDLGEGVVGEAFAYSTDRGRWHAVSWQWPVLRRDGSVDHERIVLLASSRARPRTGAPAHSGRLQSFLLSLLDLSGPSRDDSPALTRALVAVAADAVAARIDRSR